MWDLQDELAIVFHNWQLSTSVGYCTLTLFWNKFIKLQAFLWELHYHSAIPCNYIDMKPRVSRTLYNIRKGKCSSFPRIFLVKDFNFCAIFKKDVVWLKLYTSATINLLKSSLYWTLDIKSSPDLVTNYKTPYFFPLEYYVFRIN